MPKSQDSGVVERVSLRTRAPAEAALLIRMWIVLCCSRICCARDWRAGRSATSQWWKIGVGMGPLGEGGREAILEIRVCALEEEMSRMMTWLP